MFGVWGYNVCGGEVRGFSVCVEGEEVCGYSVCLGEGMGYTVCVGEGGMGGGTVYSVCWRRF